MKRVGILLLICFSLPQYGFSQTKTPFRDSLNNIYFASDPEFLEKDPDATVNEADINFDGLITQSLIALGIQHSLRFTQEKTRAELGGPFVKDWFRSVASINGWGDGDNTFTNWVGHPMMGATSAFIFAQNDRFSMNAHFGWNKDYFRAKKRQFIFAIIYSEQFESGPISESSIGNVGIHGKGNGFVDHVVTPTMGIIWSVAEDAIDAKVIMPAIRKNRILGSTLALFLNPNRSAANIVACKWPWHRKNLR